MIDVSDRREAVIWAIKACLQPTDTACGACRISLTLNTLVPPLLNGPLDVTLLVIVLDSGCLTGDLGFYHRRKVK